MPFAQNFFERLRSVRTARGLPRPALAKMLGLTNPVQICRYETGKAFPPLHALPKIAEALETDLHWLLTGSPSPGALHLIPFALQYLSDLAEDLADYKEELSSLLVKQAQGENTSDRIERVRAMIEGLDSYAGKLRERINEVLIPLDEAV